MLRPEVSKNEQIVMRFKQEAQSASQIGNQHIIDISDFGELADGSTYFVMEFLNGQSLTSALDRAKERKENQQTWVPKLFMDSNQKTDTGTPIFELKEGTTEEIEESIEALELD